MSGLRICVLVLVFTSIVLLSTGVVISRPTTISDNFCSFQTDHCNFNTNINGSGRLRRFKVGDNYVLLAEARGTLSLHSNMRILVKGRACVSFKYDVQEANGTSYNLLRISDNLSEKKMDLPVYETNGWTSVQIEVNLGNEFWIMISMSSAPSGYTRVAYGDFKVSYQPCSK